ncbi:MAG: N-acetylmuramoyl-L-alanine amidase [Flavisolibacter sp.]|nr:N-acetylmuramoyl-L-alanine amidase [Flavisolibacter sp.]
MELLCIFNRNKLFMGLHKNLFLLSSLGLLMISLGCNRRPYHSTNKSYKKQTKQLARTIQQTPLKDSIATGNWVGTTNFNLRKPNFVIIHHTAQNSCEQTLKTFTTAKTQVSAHYVICKDGTIHHMLNDYLRAWHGGVAKWGNNTDINSSSIGIEIDNNGFETFTDQQISSLLTLLMTLKKAYSIPTANFIGHQDIAPGRKVDPNVYFPWKRLADSGFGIWWSDTTNVVVPPHFNALQALRIVGYDIKDSIAVIQTFKRKYKQVEDKTALLNEGDKKILYTLYKKFE